VTRRRKTFGVPEIDPVRELLGPDAPGFAGIVAAHREVAGWRARALDRSLASLPRVTRRAAIETRGRGWCRHNYGARGKDSWDVAGWVAPCGRDSCADACAVTTILTDVERPFRWVWGNGVVRRLVFADDAARAGWYRRKKIAMTADGVVSIPTPGGGHVDYVPGDLTSSGTALSGAALGIAYVCDLGNEDTHYHGSADRKRDPDDEPNFVETGNDVTWEEFVTCARSAGITVVELGRWRWRSAEPVDDATWRRFRRYVRDAHLNPLIA
jgi:hypothetical protein